MDGSPDRHPHHPSYYRNKDSHPYSRSQPGARWEETPTGMPPPYHPHEHPPSSNVVSYDPSYDTLLAEKHAAYGPHSDPLQPPSSSSSSKGGGKDETMVELGPGMFARLRGANETWKCIENDFHVPVVCYACSLDLCCIQDASYVLCPSCRTVSPVEQVGSGHFAVDHRPGSNDGGVGLGFTFDDLIKWQGEIVRRRRAAAEQRKLQEQPQHQPHLPEYRVHPSHYHHHRSLQPPPPYHHPNHSSCGSPPPPESHPDSRYFY